MRRLRRDDTRAPRDRSPAERERARLERIARREGREPPPFEPEPSAPPEDLGAPPAPADPDWFEPAPTEPPADERAPFERAADEHAPFESGAEEHAPFESGAEEHAPLEPAADEPTPLVEPAAAEPAAVQPPPPAETPASPDTPLEPPPAAPPPSDRAPFQPPPAAPPPSDHAPLEPPPAAPPPSDRAPLQPPPSERAPVQPPPVRPPPSERAPIQGHPSERPPVQPPPPPPPPAPGDPLPPRVRVIQPDPPPPPAAPAGALTDHGDERPLGTRRAGRRPARAVVTPPADVPKGPRRRNKRKRGALAALVVLPVVLVIAVVVVLFEPFAGAAGAPVRVTIPEGADVGAIGELLDEEGVISSGFAFSIRATMSGKRGELRSGPYTLRESMSYGAVLDALTTAPSSEAPPATVDVAIPEGLSRREVAPVVEDTGLEGDYLRATRRAESRKPGGVTLPQGNTSLEGLLFPATYEVPSSRGVEALVGQQLESFETNFAEVDLRAARRKNLTAYDVLVIASMVEREARVARERPIIAAVIYNRLSDGMPLGIDATTRYETNNWTEPLTRSELESDTPYNTRTRAGLPPTPIGNPGLESMKAAARPADVDFRYFVVKPNTCGEHAFSSSFEEFQADSRRYDEERARRGGQSPSNC